MAIHITTAAHLTNRDEIADDSNNEFADDDFTDGADWQIVTAITPSTDGRTVTLSTVTHHAGYASTFVVPSDTRFAVFTD